MNLDDAHLYLPIAEDEDLAETYESQIFSQKNFFLTHFPTFATFNSRRERLEKIEEAYLFLGGQMEDSIMFDFRLNEYAGKTVKEIFNIYQKNLNELKLKVVSLRSASDLRIATTFLLDNVKNYVQFWELGLEAGDEKILISKEPDPMFIIEAINLFEDAGFQVFDDIIKLDTQNLLYRESIRLSLWGKMNRDVGSR